MPPSPSDPAPATSWSSTESESRTEPPPARTTRGRTPGPTVTPSLAQICASEGVTVGPGVLPLVVRAGGGSVRDSLSVLDQLVAGAGSDGLDYESAVALLGYTHATLLDDTVEAIAARDGVVQQGGVGVSEQGHRALVVEPV